MKIFNVKLYIYIFFKNYIECIFKYNEYNNCNVVENLFKKT